MRFDATPLAGAFIIELTQIADGRGFFARAFCGRSFAEQGLESVMVQANVSYNRRAGTLRGMHYQVAPSEEAKLVRCTRGAVHDVIVDLRPTSPTYLQHLAVVLSGENRRSLYVPPMFAHGFQTLEDDAEVSYLVSAGHDPTAERGVRYDDPRLGIHWPLPVSAISGKDAAWPDLAADDPFGRQGG